MNFVCYYSHSGNQPGWETGAEPGIKESLELLGCKTALEWHGRYKKMLMVDCPTFWTGFGMLVKTPQGIFTVKSRDKHGFGQSIEHGDLDIINRVNLFYKSYGECDPTKKREGLLNGKTIQDLIDFLS